MQISKTTISCAEDLFSLVTRTKKAYNVPSILCVKPPKFNGGKLKLTYPPSGKTFEIPHLTAPQINSAQEASQIGRWSKPQAEYIPDCSIPGSQIPSHHGVNGINHSIRDVEECRKGIVDDCQLLGAYHAVRIDKEFMNLTPLEKDCIGFRIVKRSNISEYRNRAFHTIENAKTGDIIVPDEGCAYVFHQEDLIQANNYYSKNSMIQEIRIPKGALVSRNTEHMGEILMPRGAKYKLISKGTDSNGDLRCVLEYILPESKYSEDIPLLKKVAQQNLNSPDEFNRKGAVKLLEEIESMGL